MVEIEKGKLFAENIPTIPLSIIFLVMGLIFFVLNFTMLPVFGIILGIVFFMIGGFILTKYRETKQRETEGQSA